MEGSNPANSRFHIADLFGRRSVKMLHLFVAGIGVVCSWFGRWVLDADVLRADDKKYIV